MRFPFSVVTKPLGGIAIDRRPRSAGEPRRSFVDVMVELFNRHKELVIVITPEGTRSRVEKWKTGFYHIAKQANVPIALGFCDYGSKTTGIGAMLYPTDYETDMRTIMQFYKNFQGKNHHQFSLDKDFI